jgi:hypothetical protein
MHYAAVDSSSAGACAPRWVLLAKISVYKKAAPSKPSEFEFEFEGPAKKNYLPAAQFWAFLGEGGDLYRWEIKNTPLRQYRPWS